MNLSSHILTTDEINILSKGLKFIPKPLKSNEEEVQNAFDDFSRQLMISNFFKYNGISQDSPQDNLPPKKLFVEKSMWTPPDNACDVNALEELESLNKSLRSVRLKQNKRKKNLSKAEFKALKSLQKNENIIIKPADKGSSVVILDRNSYLQEGYRQLNIPSHYRKIDGPIHPNVTCKYNSILDQIHDESFLSKKQLEYLKVPDNPRERRFYLLPKIHKDPNIWSGNPKTPPGRPIVSDCESDTYRISEYVDHFLYPLAIKHPSYIKDTPDFLEKLSNVIPDPNSFLITLDVESLYTNIDNNAGLQAVRQAFQDNPDLNRPSSEIIRLLSTMLKYNDFSFNNEWYLQVGGTAMGKKFAPNYANIFMAKWESEALNKCPKKPQCYFRYLDDIFIIWPHSREDFTEFFNILNSHHPNIKLKANIEKNSISFLDVTIFKGDGFRQTQTLDTKVYFKPTDTHELLHKSSYHPPHIFKGIVKSQIIRFKRICTNKTDFNEACHILFSVLRKRGYAYSFLRKIKRDTIYGLDSQGQSSKCEKPRCKTCKHIVTTKTIIDHNGNLITLSDKLNCQSRSIVYVIECKNCRIRYVGESCQKLKDRLNQHRSDIKCKKDTVIATHFSQNCPDVNFLQIIPLEKVPRMIPEAYTFMGMLDNSDEVRLYRREQFWMKRLKTLTPHGLNKRQELPPPIPFCMKYSDQAYTIAKLVKTTFDKIQERSAQIYWRTQIVTAYKRNRNLYDFLVNAKLK